MSTESKTVQVRKLKGLQDIVTDTRTGTTLRPMAFSTGSKSRREEGVFVGEHKGKTFLDTKQYFAPKWDPLTNKWGFEGTPQDLSRLIDKMKLQYPENDPRYKQIIKPSDSDGDRIYDWQDPVFRHEAFRGKYFMSSGRINLDTDDPRQEFVHRCYRGDRKTIDRNKGGTVNKYVALGAENEIVSPRRENIDAKRTADKEVEAIKLLAALDADVDSMRAIATAMSLPQYSKKLDSAGLFVLLKDMAAQNTEFSAKYNKTFQQKFIELAKLPPAELNIYGKVALAKRKGILRGRQGHYLFQGEKLDGIDSDERLYKYFVNPANQEDYIKLEDYLSEES